MCVVAYAYNGDTVGTTMSCFLLDLALFVLVEHTTATVVFDLVMRWSFCRLFQVWPIISSSFILGLFQLRKGRVRNTVILDCVLVDFQFNSSLVIPFCCFPRSHIHCHVRRFIWIYVVSWHVCSRKVFFFIFQVFKICMQLQCVDP